MDLNLIVEILPKDQIDTKQVFNLAFIGNSFDPNSSKLQNGYLW